MESSNQPTVWQLVLKLPYQDISGLVPYLRTNCDRYLVAEHSSDDGCKTTHCHIMLVNYRYTSTSLDKERAKYITGRGQHALLKVQEKSREPYGEPFLGAYCLKGLDYTHKSSSYTDAEIKEFIARWVPLGKAKEEKPKTQWDLIQEMRSACQMSDRAIRIQHTEGVAYVSHVCPTRENFYVMNKILNENKIKTSIHELERWWITLLRQDQRNQDDLFNKINSKLML